MDWAKILHAVAPKASVTMVAAVAPYLDTFFTRYGITDPIEQAMFIAQAACETAGFKTFVEYGNAAYFRRYDGRKDLGNSQPGDGFKFRGQGLFDLTGRANFDHYGKLMGVDLVAHPEKEQEGYYAVWSACLYWVDRKCAAPARKGDVVTVTRKINGGLNGLADRKAYFAKAKAVILAYAKVSATVPAVPAPPAENPAPVPVAPLAAAPVYPIPASPRPVPTGETTANQKGAGAAAIVVATTTAAAATPHPTFYLAIAGAVALIAVAGFIVWRVANHHQEHA